jgi:lysophospholipase L1-like esterase
MASVLTAGPRAQGGRGGEPPDRPAPRTDANSRIAHEQLLEKAGLGRIDLYFAGDSITRRWGATDYPELLAHFRETFHGWNAANFAWGGDQTQHILWRLENGELEGVNPKVVVVLAGTNNVGRTVPPGGDDEKAAGIARGIAAIVEAVQERAPDATIVLMAVFPRNDNMAVLSTIGKINERIEMLADGTRVRFLDINDRLADGQGRLRDGMSPDGLHLALPGYEVWADALRPLLLELLGPPASEDHAPPPTGDPSAAGRGRAQAPQATLQPTPQPTSGPAADGTPAWFLQGSFPDPGGNTSVDADGTVTVLPRGRGRGAAPAASDVARVPPTPFCSGAPICGNRLTPGRQELQRVQFEQTLGYTFTYPYVLPAGRDGVGTGGVPAVALDSKGNLWVFQRKPPGSSQLFKFDPDHDLILEVAPEVIGYQDKAHGMAVDAEDNVWIVDTNGASVMKLSPEGELLTTLGERGRRGDWDEARGLRRLWQPVMIAFGPGGDIYIGQGHANESPNDAGSDDPENTVGAARVLHLDRDGRFVGQWYGNSVGQGKFDSVHGLAVDPVTGDVWIGDREQYRIVVYNSAGQFLRTMQMRNLVCALQFDADGNPWMASGQDGQFLKLDRNGTVLGAVGNGMGIEHGQFIEASYWVFDADNNLYAGDTSVGRVTKMIAP